MRKRRLSSHFPFYERNIWKVHKNKLLNIKNGGKIEGFSRRFSFSKAPKKALEMSACSALLSNDLLRALELPTTPYEKVNYSVKLFFSRRSKSAKKSILYYYFKVLQWSLKNQQFFQKNQWVKNSWSPNRYQKHHFRFITYGFHCRYFFVVGSSNADNKKYPLSCFDSRPKSHR